MISELVHSITWPARSLRFQRLSWEDDFLDGVRDPNLLEGTKPDAAAARGFALELLSDLVNGLTMDKVGKHAGIKL